MSSPSHPKWLLGGGCWYRLRSASMVASASGSASNRERGVILEGCSGMAPPFFGSFSDGVLKDLFDLINVNQIVQNAIDFLNNFQFPDNNNTFDWKNDFQ
jgi:hypothetical protein